MQISSVTFCNFRCFGPEPTTISIGDITALIGENGAGKSAVLIGVARLFGLTGDDRTVRADDFHLPRGKSRADFSSDTLHLWIDVRLEFPELADENSDAAKTVPQNFRQMLVDDPASIPHCRIRLEADWQQGNLPEGEVDQRLLWVTKAAGVAEPVDSADCYALKPIDRQQIHVHYVPGARDPSRHVRVASRSILKRLLDAARWDEELQSSVEEAMKSLAKSFAEEVAVAELEKQLNLAWSTLYNRSRFKKIELQLESQSLQDVVATLSARLLADEDGESTGVERLSDGLRSLLYFSLVKSTFALEEIAIAAGADESPFDRDILNPPLLTMFAIEEPETHLAPHLLGRILRMFRDVAKSARGQAIFSSHSTSVMTRIEPQEVRHLRLNPEPDCTIVSTIVLPTGDQEADKFIRQAVQAYPELYFARVVILCEGDSEQVVLARLLEANGLPADPNVISVVPLGGRHVNHMWRLLSSLSIPYVTLLDLDRERTGGGWGRIHYACEQLLRVGVPWANLLTMGEGDQQYVMTEQQFAEVKTWEHTAPYMANWAASLRPYGVYFSSPLDVDFLMYRAFCTQYRATSPTTPRKLSDDEEKQELQLKNIAKSVLRDSDEAGETFTGPELKSLRWYRHLFLTRSKPATHLAALGKITDAELLESCPPVLKQLVTAVRKILDRT